MKKLFLITASVLSGIALGMAVMSRAVSKQLKEKQEMSDKHLTLFLLMIQWIRLKQEGKNIASYLKSKGYKKIAVYGMSYVGQALINELSGTEIEVAYGIDKNADTIYSSVDVVSMESDLKKVDAVIVTAVTFFDDIEEKLSARLECPVVSLENILYEV